MACAMRWTRNCADSAWLHANEFAGTGHRNGALEIRSFLRYWQRLPTAIGRHLIDSLRCGWIRPSGEKPETITSSCTLASITALRHKAHGAESPPALPTSPSSTLTGFGSLWPFWTNDARPP